MSKDLETKKLERDLLDSEVSLMLMKLVGEVINGIGINHIPDTDPYARRIVSYCREHIIN